MMYGEETFGTKLRMPSKFNKKRLSTASTCVNRTSSMLGQISFEGKSNKSKRSVKNKKKKGVYMTFKELRER